MSGDTDVFGGVRQPKRARSRKSYGGNENLQAKSSQSQTPNIKKEVPADILTHTATAEHEPSANSMPTATHAVASMGGKRPIKVTLNKIKISHKAVKLNPKKPHIEHTTQQQQQNQQHQQNKTKKSRKFVLGIPGLKRRITMAQKIRNKTDQTPIEQLRSELIAKGLLKAGSKTPDILVRQIAADAQILSKKGL